MKTTTWIAIVLMMAVVLSTNVSSQVPEHQGEPNRKTVRTINKSVKKEAKRLEKLGYTPEVGAPATEFQLRRAMDKEFEVDAQGRNMWVIGVGSAISGIENAARMHAVSDAAINAAMHLESRIMGLIENDYNNKLYSRDEYQTLSKMAGVFSTLLAKTLPSAVPVTSLIKDHGTYYEYQVRIAYPMEAIRSNSAAVVADILGKENDELRKKFERISGLDKLNP